MAVRTGRALQINGGRVLTLDGGGAPGSQLAGRAVTRVVIVGTGGAAGTIRQVAGGLGVIEGVVIAGAVEVPSAECPVPSGEIGVPVLGGVEDLALLVARYGLKVAVVCLPRAMAGEMEGVRAVAGRLGLSLRMVPALQDVLGVGGEGIEGSGDQGIEVEDRNTGRMPVPRTASIDLAALIGRRPYAMDREAISAIIRGKCVMITGAGGSIGSELAKVAAAFEPSLLVLVERAENALFEIDRQIARHFPGVRRKAVLHDVVDAEATLRLCESLRPQAVFHAAAHKHVPLMEDHPAHALTNNLFGTKSIADAAVACGAERFVMISSDKAVNPTSVMGATKRLAEMYVRGLGERANGQRANRQIANGEREAGTRLSMVRFGNVLGSSASVLTIWAQQIAEGGPITITDPRMTRYFMTIPEAATLVVQSATLDAGGIEGSWDRGIKGSEVGVFVLDMGEPVRIVDLAKRFVRAHGMCATTVGALADSRAGVARPHDFAQSSKVVAREPSIDLVFTGIRPGEKLHEELAYAAEQLRPTAHRGIRAWAGPGFGDEVAARMSEMVAELHAARFSPEPAKVIEAIRRHVPEMRTGLAGVDVSPEQATHPQIG